MIDRFGSETALLVIDAQKGVNLHSYWGGCGGHRNNPHAEARIADLLAAFRAAGRPVYFTFHNSREAASPLKLSLDSGQAMPGLEPIPGERVVVKDVNSGFVGTELELSLRRDGVHRLVVAGFFTNMCVDTTVRSAGNMGYDTYLVHDACAAGNRIAADGTSFDAELVHRLSVANLHGEFCTAITTADAVALLAAANPALHRVQGNELHRGTDLAEAA
ncbi:MAG: cysteine hydrolase [Sphingomonadaceae bacterium]|nr:cysteine hydrolase [Sphingomonadaceae bacterium]